MERVIIQSPTLHENILRKCADTLSASGVICYPTETFYALGIDSENAFARDKLFALKGRNILKELPYIASDVSMVRRFCETEDSRFSALAERFWPGPLTLVLPVRKTSKSIAIRVSSHPVACQIAKSLGAPLVSTSANRSGDPPVRSPDELHEAFLNDIDLIIDSGLCPGGNPSTIVSLLERRAKLIREGAIAYEVIRPFL